MVLLALSLRYISDTVLAVKTVADAATVVDTVNDPIRVVLHGCREDDDLEELRQFCQEFVAVRTHHVEEVVLAFLEVLQELVVLLLVVIAAADEMNQRLVEIEHKCVLRVANFFRRKVWRKNLW